MNYYLFCEGYDYYNIVISRFYQIFQYFFWPLLQHNILPECQSLYEYVVFNHFPDKRKIVNAFPQKFFEMYRDFDMNTVNS